MLVEMEIDPENIFKPYTLPLKHYEWVQREKATLQ